MNERLHTRSLLADLTPLLLAELLQLLGGDRLNHLGLSLVLGSTLLVGLLTSSQLLHRSFIRGYTDSFNHT